MLGATRSITNPESPRLGAQQAELGSLLLAPVGITATKALTPSHLKGLLWLDLLHKATAVVRPTSLLHNRRTLDLTQQTLGFWAYLDRQFPEQGYACMSETWIGERYIEFHRDPNAKSLSVTRYRENVEAEGYIHPASQRVLEVWQGYYDILGLPLQGLRDSRALGLSTEGVLHTLSRSDCLLDLRGLRGGVFADLTAEGIALRQLIDESGQENYLICVLRELMPLGSQFDQVLLLADAELDTDYLVLERLLKRSGAEAARFTLRRVGLGSAMNRSRDGGWQSYTVDRLIDTYLPHVGAPAFRLGLRLYFIAALGRTGSAQFEFEQLERAFRRAVRLLERVSPEVNPPELARLLRSQLTRFGYVDPYRLACLLFAATPDPRCSLLLPLFLN